MSTTKKELLNTIKAKCLECTCDQIMEVKLCPSKGCPLWPFRLAKDPHITPRQMSEAQKENLVKARAASMLKK